MWKQGLIDATVAMQLLGSGQGIAGDGPASHPAGVPSSAPPADPPADGSTSKKRPLDDTISSGSTEKPSDESLDDVLEQAKKAKLETSLNWLIFLILN